MHVAVVGAGALGGLYGTKLAQAGVTVTFVVRAARVAETAAIVLEHVQGGAREEIAHPARAAAVPPDADLVLLAVGTEDLEAIGAATAGSEAPIVVLTPMMPEDFARMREAFGSRVLAAMPGVVAYVREDGVIRAWLPPQPTLIDEPRAGEGAVVVHALVEALRRAGLRARLELGVHEKNPATTVAFIGAAMAIAVAGSLRALADDAELCALAARSCHEGRALGLRIGRAEPAAALAAALATPWGLALALRALPRLSPEAAHYAEVHFGRKLLAQHLVMAQAIVRLAAEKGVETPSFAELARRLAR